MKNKYILLILLVFGIFSLSACDGEIPDKDDVPILKDLDDNEDDDVVEVPDDLTPLEEFEFVANAFNEKVSNSNAFMYKLDFATSMISLSDLNYGRERRTTTTINYDQEDTYYYNEVMEYYYERSLHQSNQSFTTQLIDARSGSLREYEIDGQYAAIKQKYPDKEFDQLLEEQNILEYDFFDFDSIENVEIDGETYKVTVNIDTFEDGIIATRFDSLDFQEMDELIIEYTFNEFNLNYTVSFREAYTYQADNRNLDFEYTGEVKIREYLSEKISVYEEPYFLELPESKEDIEIVTDVDTFVYKFVSPNKIGWMKYVLEPGFYQFYDGGVFNGVIYTAYDEDENQLDLGMDFVLEETTTIYVKAEATVRTDVRSVFNKLDVVDLVYEDHHDLLSGTISGYNEGSEDRSTYHLNGTNENGGMIVIDASHLNNRQQLYVRNEMNICELTEEDTCIILVEPGIEAEFIIFGEYETAFTFDYYFVETTVSGPNYEDMLHLDDIDGMFNVKQGEEVYFKFDIILYDRYYFWIYDIVEQYNTASVEIYTAEGELVEPSYDFYYQLNRGSYYVKITTNRLYGMYNISLEND